MKIAGIVGCRELVDISLLGACRWLFLVGFVMLQVTVGPEACKIVKNAGFWCCKTILVKNSIFPGRPVSPQGGAIGCITNLAAPSGNLLNAGEKHVDRSAH